MGATWSNIRTGIESEFNRVTAVNKGPSRDYLVLDQVLQITNEHWPNHPLDFSHLGTLFVLDGQKNGRFYLEDFSQFSETCRQHDEKYRKTAYDFMTHFQAFCTLQMYSCASSNLGNFLDWFVQLFRYNTITETPATSRFEEYPNVEFLHYDTIRTLHQILNIRKAYSISYQSFFDLMHNAAEQQKFLRKGEPRKRGKNEDDISDYLPMPILREFAKHFISGFVNLMLELNFDPDTVSKGVKRIAVQD